MKKKKCILKLCALGIVLLMLMGSVKETVLAAAPTTGTITITLEQDLGQKAGVVFKIYQVGTWSSTYEKWTLANGLTSSQFNLLNENSTNYDWNSVADELASQVQTLGITDTQSVATDGAGKATAQELSLGMYLVIQDGNNQYGTITPFLVSLPSKGSNGYDYSPKTSPKATALPSSEGNNTPSNGGNTSTGNNTTNNSAGGSEETSGSGDENNAPVTIPEKVLQTTIPIPEKNTMKKGNNTSLRKDGSEEEAQTGETDIDESVAQESEQETTEENENRQESNESVTEEDTSSDRGVNPFVTATVGTVMAAMAGYGGFLFFKKFKKM